MTAITDIHGAFRYAGDPSGVLQKMGQLLKRNGRIYLFFGDNLTIDPKSFPDIKFPRARTRALGSGQLFHLWLQSIKGLKLLFPSTETNRAAILERTDEPLEIPPLRRREGYDHSSPTLDYMNFLIDPDQAKTMRERYPSILNSESEICW